MTDTILLRQKIRDSGYRIHFVAEQCGLSHQGLLNKINNKSEFNATEIKALQRLLKLNWPEVASIFFNDKVDRLSTEQKDA